MAKKGPIIIIEDDEEDQDIISEVFTALKIPNQLIRCENGFDAWNLLLNLQEAPFLILSDINMPMMNGLDLLKKIYENEEMKRKSIPFIFFSTTAKKGEVESAYEMTVQGFFIKGSSFESLKRTLGLIVDYWSTCIHPQGDF